YCGIRLGLAPQPLVCTAAAQPGRGPLSLHDALPICGEAGGGDAAVRPDAARRGVVEVVVGAHVLRVQPGRLGQPHVMSANNYFRSEEHTSELQSPYDVVCRLLLEKKNTAVGG